MSDERGSGVILASGVSLATRLAVSVLCARMLGGAEYGRFACLVFLVEICATLIEFGVADATVRQLPRLEEGRRAGLARWSARLHLGLGALVVGAVAIAAPWWPGVELAGPSWAAALCYAAARGAGAVGSAQLAGRQRWSLLARAWILSTTTSAACSLIGAWLAGTSGCLLGLAVGAVIPGFALALARDVPEVRVEADAGERRAFARVAIACWASGGLSALVWTRGELFFLERMVGEHEVGVYVATLAITTLPMLIGSALTPTLVPRLLTEHARGDTAAVAALHASAVRLIALVVLPLVALIASSGSAIVRLAYGPGFDAHASTVMLLGMGALVVCFAPTAALLHALGRFRLLVGATLVGTIVLVSIACLFPRGGTLTAAAARVTAQAAIVVLHVAASARGGFAFPTRDLLALMIAAALSGAVMALALVLVPGPGVALAAGALGGVFTYLVVVRCAHLVRAEDRARLDAACAPLPPVVRAAVRLLLG